MRWQTAVDMPRRIVELLGAGGPLEFRRDANGVTISLPENRPAGPMSVTAFAIMGKGIAQS